VARIYERPVLLAPEPYEGTDRTGVAKFLSKCPSAARRKFRIMDTSIHTTTFEIQHITLTTVILRGKSRHG
jgi:hypothetical protein